MRIDAEKKGGSILCCIIALFWVLLKVDVLAYMRKPELNEATSTAAGSIFLSGRLSIRTAK